MLEFAGACWKSRLPVRAGWCSPRRGGHRRRRHQQFRGIRTPDEVVGPIREAHALLERLGALFPTVAAINGACLGGGLELASPAGIALSDDPKTVFDCQVLLGIHRVGARCE
jgi:enoyl-CoA hydratase/carnithine racemase